MVETSVKIEASGLIRPVGKHNPWASWLKAHPWVRRTIITFGFVLSVLLGVQVVVLLLAWKHVEVWVSFMRDFVTSPAMAGMAALIAAIIGARSLKRQLDQTKRQADHTQAEAVHARAMDAEASWWEKFEWVTDRILPKDPKQEKLAKPLAIGLLTSLLNMATAEFQRGAVDGVIEHYLAPENDEGQQKPGPSSKDYDAELRALRSLVDARKNSAAGSSAAEGALRASMYEQSAFDALQSVWQLGNELQFLPRLRVGERHFIPDAILNLDGRRMILEFKAWTKFQHSGADRVLDMFSRALPVVDADRIILITSAPIPPEYAPGGFRANRFENLLLVHWLPEDGSAALEDGIRRALSWSDNAK
ncbi:hypothetical protein QWJ39_05045 [Arthrobacter sp. YD4]|uniref:hypothetical protein n=1 Tax=Arthrobacter sp. YD4 TaxID=3058043 RepID=UPI0025B2DDF9|nr:hypothetical protein [Arthrobacter sp. YD4]MDN3935675.1 hypothetical protein [Arthrobacter sp. YD4]